MKRIAVFCGSSTGIDNDFTIAAESLGSELVKNGLGMVFGGGAIGLMGIIAKKMLKSGGEVIGVIPENLFKKQLALRDLTDLRIVGSMHERKALISELSDGFIAMPGGLGTIEEIFEVLTWSQLGIHTKPCGFLNVCNYFKHLINFLDHMTDQNFIDDKHRSMIIIEENPEILLAKFKDYKYQNIDKSAWALNMLKHNK